MTFLVARLCSICLPEFDRLNLRISEREPLTIESIESTITSRGNGGESVRTCDEIAGPVGEIWDGKTNLSE
jgi:hypothetical protein